MEGICHPKCHHRFSFGGSSLDWFVDMHFLILLKLSVTQSPNFSSITTIQSVIAKGSDAIHKNLRLQNVSGGKVLRDKTVTLRRNTILICPSEKTEEANHEGTKTTSFVPIKGSIVARLGARNSGINDVVGCLYVLGSIFWRNTIPNCLLMLFAVF